MSDKRTVGQAGSRLPDDEVVVAVVDDRRHAAVRVELRELGALDALGAEGDLLDRVVCMVKDDASTADAPIFSSSSRMATWDGQARHARCAVPWAGLARGRRLVMSEQTEKRVGGRA